MNIPENLYYSSFPTGSHYICNPPVTDTDIDIMYFVKDMYEADRQVIAEGWEPCDKGEYGIGPWRAYRKGKYNALLTSSFKYYIKFEAATELAKKRNLLEKEERIELFHIITGN
jgi:hypothetical protein